MVNSAGRRRCRARSYPQRQGEEPGLVEADGGKLQVHGCCFRTDEPSIALRPGLKYVTLTENNGVRGVEILNEIGGTAVVANNEQEAERPEAGVAKGGGRLGLMGMDLNRSCCPKGGCGGNWGVGNGGTIG